jgi:hypothetical protein
MIKRIGIKGERSFNQMKGRVAGILNLMKVAEEFNGEEIAGEAELQNFINNAKISLSTSPQQDLRGEYG